MRIAILSDVHGNLTALEAVLEDLRQTSPDMVFHGGDLTASGSSSGEVVDCIRDMGWQGVVGNTDEMLFRPDSLQEFASHSPHLQSLFAAIEDIAAEARQTLGEERLSWLRTLPRCHVHAPIALVHATPETFWRAPVVGASDSDLMSAYGTLGQPVIVYAHIHQPFVRNVQGRIVANTGSVSLSYDGDPRSSYLIVDDGKPEIRRVEYQVEREVKSLYERHIPHADWIVNILRTAHPQMP